jgi:hypothetical protein
MERRSHGASAILIAATLMSLQVQAAATDDTSVRDVSHRWQQLDETNLSRVSASGFTDRLFERMAYYAAAGNGIEVLGDTAMLLNPVLSLVDPGMLFRQAIFTPSNFSTVVDREGNALVRFQGPPMDIVSDLPGRGAAGGSVAVRGIDLRGTVIRISARH